MAPLVGLIPLFASIGGGVAASVAAHELTKPKTPPAVPSTATSQADIATEADKTSEDLRAKARAAGSGARQSTILTSPLGVVNTAPPKQKTLLGS